MAYVTGATYTDLAVRARVRFSALGDGTGFAGGIAIGKRISAVPAFIVAGLAVYDQDPASCRLVFSIDGTEHPVEVCYRLAPNTDYEITVQFLSSGIAAAWVTPARAIPGEPLLVMDDARLATGGIDDDGHVCVLDRWGFAAASTRTISKLAAWAPETSHVIAPDQSMRFTHETAESENAAGTDWGRVPHFEAARLKIPPSTRNGYRAPPGRQAGRKRPLNAGRHCADPARALREPVSGRRPDRLDEPRPRHVRARHVAADPLTD